MRRGHTDLEHDFLQPSLTIEDAESESESDESYYPELGSEPDTEDEEVGVMGSRVGFLQYRIFTLLCIVQVTFPAGLPLDFYCDWVLEFGFN